MRQSRLLSSEAVTVLDNVRIKPMVQQVYAPPSDSARQFSLERWLGIEHQTIRYFSLGRHALVAALRIAGVGSGDIVALPEFICRDLLAAVVAVGASVMLYPVDERLVIADIPKTLMNAKALVAVNFFGFPQDLSPFQDIALQSGAIIIEDNAHGCLSRDGNGVPLGRRASLGIYSLRKTFPLINGGALVVNDPALISMLPEKLLPNCYKESWSYLYKQYLRKTVPHVGTIVCCMSTGAIRLLRKLKTGYSIPPPDPDSETTISLQPNPHAGIMNQLSQVDDIAEIDRRRALYSFLDGYIRKLGGFPIFDVMPQGVSPYVMPFRASDEAIKHIGKHLQNLGLECHRWPELPHSIVNLKIHHYHNVWMVPFLW